MNTLQSSPLALRKTVEIKVIDAHTLFLIASDSENRLIFHKSALPLFNLLIDKHVTFEEAQRHLIEQHNLFCSYQLLDELKSKLDRLGLTESSAQNARHQEDTFDFDPENKLDPEVIKEFERLLSASNANSWWSWKKLSAFAVGLVFFFMPWNEKVYGPAIVLYQDYSEVSLPENTEIASLHVQNGASVGLGQDLATIMGDDLGQKTITSPRSGTVEIDYHRHLRESTEVRTAPSIRVVGSPQKKLIIYVDQNQIGKLEIGDLITFRLRTDPMEKYQAKVSFISSDITTIPYEDLRRFGHFYAVESEIVDTTLANELRAGQTGYGIMRGEPSVAGILFFKNSFLGMMRAFGL